MFTTLETIYEDINQANNYILLVAEYRKKRIAAIKHQIDQLIKNSAHSKGYTIGPVYHGSKSLQTFDEFDPKKMESDSRMFFTMDKRLANTYTDLQGHVITAYLRIDDLDDYSTGEHTNPSGIKPVVYYGMFDPNRVKNKSRCYAVHKPEQIKFADITYDANRVVIPLEKRFDINNKNMKY
jgi:hypothetical protein